MSTKELLVLCLCALHTNNLSGRKDGGRHLRALLSLFLHLFISERDALVGFITPKKGV